VPSDAAAFRAYSAALEKQGHSMDVLALERAVAEAGGELVGREETPWDISRAGDPYVRERTYRATRVTWARSRKQGAAALRSLSSLGSLAQRCCCVSTAAATPPPPPPNSLVRARLGTCGAACCTSSGRRACCRS
jgi:hypothetical protein